MSKKSIGHKIIIFILLFTFSHFTIILCITSTSKILTWESEFPYKRCWYKPLPIILKEPAIHPPNSGPPALILQHLIELLPLHHGDITLCTNIKCIQSNNLTKIDIFLQRVT